MIKKILRKDIKLSLLNIRWCRIMQGVVLLSGLAVNAQNPIIQTSYTADPAPMVYNDKLYLYTSHDEDGSTWFTMNDWKLYSTDDMVNWTNIPLFCHSRHLNGQVEMHGLPSVLNVTVNFICMYL